MPTTSKDYLSQIDNLLSTGNQSWLFGAGISTGAKIPLMNALTNRVSAMIEAGKTANVLLNAIKNELPESAHIEHILSQLGDYAAIADRTKKNINIGKSSFSLTDLCAHHDTILRAIAETIRWGYASSKEKEGESPAIPEQIGSYKSPLVSVDDHSFYVRALLGRSQAGVAGRRAVRLFTTNYDTLLEDALALEGFPYWDGFSGGAVAFRNYRYGDSDPKDSFRAHVIKLHGSIDWHLSEDGKVWRVRDVDKYPSRSGRVLIYPQSTKYLATQRDPFSAQFDLLRRALSQRSENVLAICGYSFGDEHINQEIEIALSHPENKTTILAFTQTITDAVGRWQKSSWKKRLYIVTENGLFVGGDGPYHEPPTGKKHDWWKFTGVTKILNEGAEAYIK